MQKLVTKSKQTTNYSDLDNTKKLKKSTKFHGKSMVIFGATQQRKEREVQVINSQDYMDGIFGKDRAAGQAFLDKDISWLDGVLSERGSVEDNNFIVAAAKTIFFMLYGAGASLIGQGWTKGHAEARALIKNPPRDISESVKYFQVLSRSDFGKISELTSEQVKELKLNTVGDSAVLQNNGAFRGIKTFEETFKANKQDLINWLGAIELLSGGDFDTHQQLVAVAVDNVMKSANKSPLTENEKLYLVDQASSIWIKPNKINDSIVYAQYAEKIAGEFNPLEHENLVDYLSGFNGSIAKQAETFATAIITNDPRTEQSLKLKEFITNSIKTKIWDALKGNPVFGEKMTKASETLRSEVNGLRDFSKTTDVIARELSGAIRTAAEEIGSSTLTGESVLLLKLSHLSHLPLNLIEALRSDKETVSVDGREIPIKEYFARFVSDEGINYAKGNNAYLSKDKAIDILYAEWKGYCQNVLPSYEKAVSYLRETPVKELSSVTHYNKEGKEKKANAAIEKLVFLANFAKNGSDAVRLEFKTDVESPVPADLINNPYNLSNDAYKEMFENLIGRSDTLGSATLASEFIGGMKVGTLIEILAPDANHDQKNALGDLLENLVTDHKHFGNNQGFYAPGLKLPIILKEFNDERRQALIKLLDQIDSTEMNQDQEDALNIIADRDPGELDPTLNYVYFEHVGEGDNQVIQEKQI